MVKQIQDSALGVLGLGLIVLFASNLVAAEQLYPWLGLISGVTIIVVGLWLLIARCVVIKEHRTTTLTWLPLPDPIPTHRYTQRHRSQLDSIGD